jgi:hypothetical protein
MTETERRTELSRAFNDLADQAAVKRHYEECSAFQYAAGVVLGPSCDWVGETRLALKQNPPRRRSSWETKAFYLKAELVGVVQARGMTRGY